MLSNAIDLAGRLSQRAQGLSKPVTAMEFIMHKGQKLYLYTTKSEVSEASKHFSGTCLDVHHMVFLACRQVRKWWGS